MGFIFRTMKTIYDNKLGTTIKEVFYEGDVIDFINSNKNFTDYIISTPNRTSLYVEKSLAIKDIKATSQYADIVHMLTVNNVLIVEY